MISLQHALVHQGAKGHASRITHFGCSRHHHLLKKMAAPALASALLAKNYCLTYKLTPQSCCCLCVPDCGLPNKFLSCRCLNCLICCLLLPYMFP